MNSRKIERVFIGQRLYQPAALNAKPFAAQLPALARAGRLGYGRASFAGARLCGGAPPTSSLHKGP
jgi:hypothetical protein